MESRTGLRSSYRTLTYDLKRRLSLSAEPTEENEPICTGCKAIGLEEWMDPEKYSLFDYDLVSIALPHLNATNDCVLCRFFHAIYDKTHDVTVSTDQFLFTSQRSQRHSSKTIDLRELEKSTICRYITIRVDLSGFVPNIKIRPSSEWLQHPIKSIIVAKESMVSPLNMRMMSPCSAA